MTPSLPWLSTAEVAARLRIRPATVYAYVSRGLLHRTRNGAGSWFDPLEVERFARRSRRGMLQEPGPQPGAPLMVLDTEITLIEDGHLYFRGRDARTMAAEWGFERTVSWVWHGNAAPIEFRVPTRLQLLLDELTRAAGPESSLLTRMQIAAIAAEIAAPSDADPFRAGAEIIASFVLTAGGTGPGDIATRLARVWGAPELRPAIDVALTLSIDHDLAVSTLAARVAASARATPAAAISAALGAFSGPLHGTASRESVELLRDTMRVGVESALKSALHESAGVPGFGHRMYSGEDPRASAIISILREIPGAHDALKALDALSRVIRDRLGLYPNIDAALAILVIAGECEDDAAAAIFAIGRCAGWLAHIAAEYRAAPLRLRPHGRYIETSAAISRSST